MSRDRQENKTRGHNPARFVALRMLCYTHAGTRTHSTALAVSVSVGRVARKAFSAIAAISAMGEICQLRSTGIDEEPLEQVAQITN
jgi:hypothetical protein